MQFIWEMRGGGMEKSAIGPGIKARGSNYVAQFMSFEENLSIDGPSQVTDPSLASLSDKLRHSFADSSMMDFYDANRVTAAIRAYDRWVRREFAKIHGHFRLVV